ncbi:Golgi membrane exchange factor (Ric1p-Rgp1p) subunit, partial [Dimargaris xerosporica]
MGLTVTVRIDQHGVFFAGETLRCTVTFHHARPPKAAPGNIPFARGPRRRNVSTLSIGSTGTRHSEQRYTNGDHEDDLGDGALSRPMVPLEPSRSNSPLSDAPSLMSALGSTASHQVPRTRLHSDLNPTIISESRRSSIDWSLPPPNTELQERWTAFGLPELMTNGALQHPSDLFTPPSRSRAASSARSPNGDNQTMPPWSLVTRRPQCSALTDNPPSIANECASPTDTAATWSSWLGLGRSDPPNFGTTDGPMASSPEAPPVAASFSESLWSRFPNMLRATSSDRSRPASPAGARMSRASSGPPAAHRTEKVIWAFAQVVGTLAVDPHLIRTEAFEPLQSAGLYPTAMACSGKAGGAGPMATPRVMGGGSLGHSGAPIASLKSSTASVRVDAAHATRSYRTTTAYQTVGPLFSTPPSILLSDLSLAPGQSKQLRYSLPLPHQLPPSFRGRSVRLTYTLVLVVQKNALNQQSRTIPVPFKVLGSVAADGSTIAYNVLEPVMLVKDRAKVTELTQPTRLLLPLNGTISLKQSDFLREIIKETSPLATGLSNGSQIIELATSYHHVEDWCRLRQPLTLNLNHSDGQRVAQVTLPKRNYQIGETITGVVDFAAAKASCFQLSVWLECEETVGADFRSQSTATLQRLTRKVYAEYHEFCRFTSRQSFLVACPPSYYTPTSFRTSAFAVRWSLRVELIVGAANAPDSIVPNGMSTVPASIASKTPATPHQIAAPRYVGAAVLDPMKLSYQYQVYSATAMPGVSAETMS